MRACVLLMLTLAGCLAPNLVPCGELICPANQTCIGGQRCANADEIRACEGIVDGEACSLDGVTGRCDLGACLAAGCGNGIVDPLEECDDSNVVSGDGCRADCRKLEVCGDGQLDDGEACDDGNANDADGCGACAPTTWRATARVGGNFDPLTIGLTRPCGLAVDRAGNLYIANQGAQRIQRLSTTGLLETIAGTGIAGFGGDGGPATSAQLAGPSGVDVDGAGNIYVADTGNNRIRRIDTRGVITTIAGTGHAGFQGDGASARNASLQGPHDVAVDGLGSVFIADTQNERIRMVDPSGRITTLAGTGYNQLSGDGGPAVLASVNRPVSVAVDAIGNLYIADSLNNAVRKIDTAQNITSLPIALSDPFAVAVDDTGAVIVADSSNHRILRVDPAGTVTTVAGTQTYGFSGDGGPATSATLERPWGVVVDGFGQTFIADTYNRRVRRVSTSGVISTVAGTGLNGDAGGGGGATSTRLGFPNGVAVDALGHVYVADQGQVLIRDVSPLGIVTNLPFELNYVVGVAADALGNVYVMDTGAAAILKRDTSNTITTVAGGNGVGYSGDGGPATAARVAYPHSAGLDAAGNLYIADTGNDRVRKIDPAGIITTVAGNGTSGFSGDGGAATDAQLNGPSGIAIDAAGNLFIADWFNHRIRKVDTAGDITTIAGTGVAGFSGDEGPATAAQFDQPYGVAVDASGSVYVSDSNNARIRRIDPTGKITTIAGDGSFTFSGDGGPAREATIGQPRGISLDSTGRLYVADIVTHHIRRIDTAGIITTIAGSIDPIGMGLLPESYLADPRAFVVAEAFVLIAGGVSGTLQAIRSEAVTVVAGRYPQPIATGTRARFRDSSFGTIEGIAYDESAGLVYVTESSSNRLQVVTLVDIDDPSTWLIAPLNSDVTGGWADGPLVSARFRTPTGLYFDAATRRLYVADTDNHAVRVIDLANGIANATVSTIAGTPRLSGFSGDGGLATAALLAAPRALSQCANGDLFIADTANNRVRRIRAGTISTVLGDGVASSSGEGTPATTLPVDMPVGVACDAAGNLFATSRTTIRLVPADETGAVDGSGPVFTIYGAPPRDTVPAVLTRCLTGIQVIDAITIQVVDSCSGLLVELQREAL